MMNATSIIHFPYISHLCKELVLLFYNDNTVDVGYKQQVDNAIYIVFHDNNWWNLMIHDNANHVMVEL